jgi:hypothetical protein
MTSSLVAPGYPGTLFAPTSYSPLGALAQATFGNGAVETNNYDTRKRLACENVVMGGTTLYNVTLSNATAMCPGYTFANATTKSGYSGNSDVIEAFDSVNGHWNYTYDDLNRLESGSQAAGVGPLYPSGGQLGWAYDRFSNRWSQSETGYTTQSLMFTGGNNRVNTYTYDAVGNLLNDGVHVYTYDDENRIATATLIGGGY